MKKFTEKVLRKAGYTFVRRSLARTVSGDFVTVPDQVEEDQREFDGRTFPVERSDGRMARATLRGDLYGLDTPGTGDMVVSMS